MNDWQFRIVRFVCASLFTFAMFLVPLLQNVKHFFDKTPILGTLTPASLAVLNIFLLFSLQVPNEEERPNRQRHKWAKKTAVDIAMLLFGFGFNHISDGSNLVFVIVILLSGYGMGLLWVGAPCLGLEFSDVILGLLLEVSAYKTHHPFKPAISIFFSLILIVHRARVHFLHDGVE